MLLTCVPLADSPKCTIPKELLEFKLNTDTLLISIFAVYGSELCIYIKIPPRSDVDVNPLTSTSRMVLVKVRVP